ncbi:membrane protein [Bacteroides faecalis]|uniref:Membrane protein n=2 Tax=Bacteroides faecalis TaxID=2447885 RepID=A0A401LWA2_9BACE|nr:membrane protein [Bacteroides faecalis]
MVMNRMNYLMNGLAALAFIILFSQCAGKADNQTATTTTTTTAQANAELAGIKIAYVEIDTLLTKYNFCIDLNEAMMKKSENIRLTLTEKATALQKEQQDFQKKYENNAFLSQERAQQEYSRLTKMEQDLEALRNKLQNGLMEENNKNSLMFRDSINAFLKEYNKTHGYNLIFSNTGFDNLLYADSVFNITKEIVDGLNARYSSPSKK